jgi:uncharacterized protein YegL
MLIAPHFGLLQRELFEHLPRSQIRHSRSVNMQPKKPLPNIGDTVKSEVSVKEFTISQPRPLPVLLLLDASGSMSEAGKIEALNRAVEEMLATFAAEPEVRSVIQVGAVAFGGDVRVHLPPLPADDAKKKWRPLMAKGNTPLGATLTKLQTMLEDKTLLPSRSYRPTLVLISDGQATDEWASPLRQLLDSPRASKAARMAMAIGSDADMQVLQNFLSSSRSKVFQAHQARDIHKFFRWVTMSVTIRSRSDMPDTVSYVDPIEIDEIRY